MNQPLNLRRSLEFSFITSTTKTKNNELRSKRSVQLENPMSSTKMVSTVVELSCYRLGTGERGEYKRSWCRNVWLHNPSFKNGCVTTGCASLRFAHTLNVALAKEDHIVPKFKQKVVLAVSKQTKCHVVLVGWIVERGISVTVKLICCWLMV